MAKKAPVYKLANGSVPALITSHLTKKGKLKCDNGKQERVLRGACVHHRLNRNGKLKATTDNDGKGKCYCRICKVYFPTTPFDDDSLEEIVSSMEDVNNQAKFMVTAVGADNESQRYFAETGAMLALYPKSYRRLLKVAKKADSVKNKKKKKRRGEGASSYGAWR